MNNNEQYRIVLEEQVMDIHALRRVFKTSDGKRALKVIKHFCLAGKQVYVPGMGDSHTNFRCGVQQPYLDIKNLLDADPAEIVEKMNAQTKEKPYEL